MRLVSSLTWPSCVAATCLLVLSSTAQAGMVRFDKDSYGDTGGGEFRFEVLSGPIGVYPRSTAPIGPDTGSLRKLEVAGRASASSTGYIFTTFCLEKNEYIGPANATYRAEVSSIAFGGGLGATAGDVLDGATRFLYAAFATGKLGDSLLNDNRYVYNNVDARSASANALQRAIWALEEEDLNPSTDDNVVGMPQFRFFYNLGLYAAGKLGLFNDDNDFTVGTFHGSAYDTWIESLRTDANSVKAMNVYGRNLNGDYVVESQSQLILDIAPSNTPSVVPLPAAFAGGLLLMGAKLLSRQRRGRA